MGRRHRAVVHDGGGRGFDVEGRLESFHVRSPWSGWPLPLAYDVESTPPGAALARRTGPTDLSSRAYSRTART